MNLTLKIWRQKDASTKGQMVDYKVTEISEPSERPPMYSFEVDAKCVTSTSGTDAPRPETSVTSGINE